MNLSARRSVCAATLYLAVAASSVAQAEGPPVDTAAAQVLFDQGRKLMVEGRYADACPKLAESQRLDPGMGTQFNLSDCYEHIGMTASAWTGFLEVAAAARAAHQPDREQVARDRASAIEPKLSKLTITPPADADGTLAITRDGVQVNKVLWGTAVPIDPGAHTITASAPGKARWETTLHVEPGRAPVLINVPSLQDAVGAAAPAPPAPEAAPPPPPGEPPPAPSPGLQWSTARTISVSLGSAGIAGVVVGSAFGLVAMGKKADSQGHCQTNANGNQCDTTGLPAVEDGRKAGNISTVAFIAGGTLLTAGVVAWFWPAPPATSSQSARISALPNLDPNGPGVFVRGAW